MVLLNSIGSTTRRRPTHVPLALQPLFVELHSDLVTSRVLHSLSLLAFVVLVPLGAHAQETSTDETEDGCPVDDLALADASDNAERASVEDDPSLLTNPTPATAVKPTSPAEQRVQSIIADDGVHVVHFWAPWCPNAKSELAAGWDALIADNPEVSFTFVSIWNDGAPGTEVLKQYNIQERVVTLTQADPGPSDNEAERRRRFLGIPVTWTPSTWIFHQNGELAFAMNYGEMPMETIQSLLDATQADW